LGVAVGGAWVVCGGGSVAVKCPETVQLCMHMYINTPQTHTHTYRRRASKREEHAKTDTYTKQDKRGVQGGGGWVVLPKGWGWSRGPRE